MIDWNKIDWRKTIICDIDDTISTHSERDYINAIPHDDIINKLNHLHDIGYIIIYFTARGMLSCGGNVEKIEKERRPILEKWMKNNGVKYYDIIFGKPLGIMYIDDKGISPEDFMNVKFEQLKGGSGAEIVREGNRVRKTANNVVAQYNWYKLMEGYIKVPKVHSIIYNTIDMEFVEGTLMSKLDNILIPLAKVYDIVTKDFAHLSGTGKSFSTYIQRITDHLNLGNYKFTKEVIDTLTNESLYFDRHASFCHGDLTFENIIISGKWNEVCFIDPNYDEDCWASYLLDIAKMHQSIRFNYEFEFTGNRDCKYNSNIMEYIKRREGDIYKYVTILEMTHWVRMLKYKKSPNVKEKIINNIYILLNEIQGL